MTKGNRKYIIVLALCFIGLITIQLLAPKPINWNLSYSKKDKIPYGTSALYNVLPDLFPGQQITDASMPVYNTLTENNTAAANYIVINALFQVDSLDMRNLFNFVEKGNSAFIAANDFEGVFADSLKLGTTDFNDLNLKKKKDNSAVSAIYNYPGINFINPALKNNDGYQYTKCFDNVCFSSFDTSKATVLGNNTSGRINFISMKIGKGTIYISTVPEAFCNYNVVHEKNQDYASKALSYLPLQPIIWDEYYKANNKVRESILRVIFNNPALSMAYYILLFALICFMVFAAKRKQRIIPVIEPLQNTTLQFVDIVGSLYYQTRDHKNIADKKIIYFLEYIRTAFQVKTNVYDDVFIRRISDLSGIDDQQVKELFYYFSEIGIKQTITQQELIRLNKMIGAFHKLNKR
ncbi:MAG: hypothetical protein JWP12_1901 [Bacteroidetes bacterium]|nr:hypothetical protein [Bacteroidota bacterium]